MKYWISAAIVVVLFAFTVGRSVDLSAGKSMTKLDDVPVTCVFCQALFYAFEQKVIPTVQSEEAMQELVTNLCLSIPSNFTTNSTCKLVGATIGSELWKYKHMSTKEACEQLHQCPSSADSAAHLEFFAQLMVESNRNGSLECRACKDVMEAVKTLVLSNEKWIANEVKNLFCDNLPEQAADECKTAMDKDLPELLEKYLVPEQICGLLNMC